LSAIFESWEVERKMLPMDRVVKRIGERLSNITIGQPDFVDRRYKPHDFNVDYFHPIKKVELDSALSFIDGGNIPIINAHNLSVQLVRIYSIFLMEKRELSRKGFHLE